MSFALSSVAKGQQIIAHRGASHDAPENTLAAFRLAWSQGADGIEGDFYLSSDGRIVCIHDKDTERTGGEKLVVAESTYDELRALDVGAWKAEAFRGERIPTIEEVLATVPCGKTVFLELKVGPEIVEPLEKVLQQSSIDPEQIVFISFHDDTIAECKKRMPAIKTQWLTGYKNDAEDDCGAWVPTADEVATTMARIGADALGSMAETRHFNGVFLEELRGRGIAEFGVWTVNDVETFNFYHCLGAETITTDRPGWLRAQVQACEPSETVQDVDVQVER